MCVNVFSCKMCKQPQGWLFQTSEEGRKEEELGREGRESEKAARVGSTRATFMYHSSDTRRGGIDALFEVNCMPVHHSMKVKT